MKCLCGRAFASNVPRKFKCRCGQTVRVGGNAIGDTNEKVRQRWQAQVDSVCNDTCPHWMQKRGCNGGCKLSPTKPCDIGMYHRKGYGCFADPPRFRSLVSSVDPMVPNCLDDVQIIAVHFNPARSQRLAATFAEWRGSLGMLADRLVCYEAVFGDAGPEIPGSVVCRGDIMWQKESLLNRALDDCTTRYFAWIDHDLCLQSPTWLSDSLAKLDAGVKAVQLFHKITYLDASYRKIKSKPGRVAGGSAAPGGAWIAETDWLRSIGGFYDRSVVGSGDEWFYAAATGDMANMHARIRNRLSVAMAADSRRYIEQAGGRPATVDHINCQTVHLWHGDSKHRQYATREQILQRHDFDPNRDVRRNGDGILSWSTYKPRLHAEIRQFFLDRRDDG